MNDRDELMDEISGHPIGSGYYSTSVGIDEAREIADAILAAGYRRPRVVTTADEIRDLPALTIVVYDDMATGGLLQTYVVPDDGTVMFKDCGEFHLMTFGGDYIDAKDMPLPLTVVYEVGA